MAFSDPGGGGPFTRAYCREKAAQCFELAERTGNKTEAKMLIRLAQRFIERAKAPADRD